VIYRTAQRAHTLDVEK